MEGWFALVTLARQGGRVQKMRLLLLLQNDAVIFIKNSFLSSFQLILDCVKAAGICNTVPLLVVLCSKGCQTWSSKYMSDMKCS